jgi:ribosome-binding ATPase YchF (GTP1/OBG family)
MWMLQILKKDWDKTVKRAEGTKEELASLLEDKLSGLGVSRDHLLRARHNIGLNFERPTLWRDSDLLKLISELRKLSKPILIAANKMDVPPAPENLKKLASSYAAVPCCAEAELALRRASESGIITYVPGDSGFNIVQESKLTPGQKNALKLIKDEILTPLGSTGVQEALNLAFFKLLRMITVYPVEDPEKLTDHKGRVLPDVYLVPEGTTAKQFAGIIHSDLASGFLYATEARTKMRMGEDHVLKDRDVISISSIKRHA